MIAEELFAIKEIRGWITRNGRGIIYHREVTDYDRKVLGATHEETRYIICKANSHSVSHVMTEGFYRTPMEDECAYASGVIRDTRRYKNELDKQYFKFYDDADEVRQNIIRFITWTKNRITQKINKKDLKKILDRNADRIKDVTPTQEWEKIASMDGLNVKKRSDLKPLARDLQDDLDLVPERL